MRQGNFTELLNTDLTGSSTAGAALSTQQRQPGDAAGLQRPEQRVLPEPDQRHRAEILNLYPLPNTNGGKTYNELRSRRQNTDNTWQWDGAHGLEHHQHDQAFARFSYLNEPAFHPPRSVPFWTAAAMATTAI